MAAVSVDITIGTLNIGSTYRLRFVISKDGAAWDLSDGAVTLVFKNPDRSTQFSRSAVALDAVGGVFYYDTTDTELDTVGIWTLGVRVADGAVRMRYPREISFEVVDEP